MRLLRAGWRSAPPLNCGVRRRSKGGRERSLPETPLSARRASGRVYFIGRVDLKPIALYADFRAAILETFQRIQNAGPLPDATRPNSTIRVWLQQIRDDFLARSEQYGFYIAKRHCQSYDQIWCMS